MRAVLQRVKSAKVKIGGEVYSKIGYGLLVYLAVKEDDSEKDIDYMIRKIVNLRVFDDEDGKMNLSALEVDASLLIVSQFTLYGDARKGRRPSYIRAGSPEKAKRVYDRFIERVLVEPLTVKTGEFQAIMEVESVNDGPVTILLDSEKKF